MFYLEMQLAILQVFAKINNLQKIRNFFIRGVPNKDLLLLGAEF